MAKTHSNLHFKKGPCRCCVELVRPSQAAWSPGPVSCPAVPPPAPHLYRLRSVNQSWTTITTWQTVNRKAAICSD